MSALDYILSTDGMTGRGHPTLPDTLNAALRQLLSESGYDPDATTFPGLVGPVANIRAFGAVGAGESSVAADTAALVAACAASRFVFVPDGIFTINDVIPYMSGAYIFGNGEGSIIRNSSSRNPNDAMMMRPTSNGRTNVTVRDLVLDQRGDVLGQSPSSACLSINVVTGVNVDNVIFRNIITMAIWADTPVAQGTTKAVRIRGIRVENSAGGGVSIFGNISQWVVANSVFENCKDDAIAFQERTDGAAPSDLAILGNVVLNCDRRNVASSTPRGILLQGCSRFSVTGNVVNKTVSDGICLIPNTVACSRGVVSGNTVYQAGITVDSTAGVPGNGIRVESGVDISMDGNHVAGSRESGLRVHVAPDRIRVTNNGFVGNGFSGAELQNVRDYVFSDNLSCDNGTNPGSPQPFGLFLSPTTRDVKNGIVTGNRLGNSALGVSGFSQTEGIRIATGGGFNVVDATITDNNMIGNTTSAFGGVVGTNILKARNRQTTGPQTGRAVLVNGTVTVSTTEILAGDNVALTRVVGTGTTRGILTVGTIVAGTSFVIRAEDLAGALSTDDDSTVFWEIVH